MNITEELLDLHSLKGQTRGVDLFDSVCLTVDEMKLPWSKVSGIVTDGVPPWLVSEVDYPHGYVTKSANREARQHCCTNEEVCSSHRISLSAEFNERFLDLTVMEK